ncbi:glycosylphosphatidylinositol anchor biosynthesis, partial [Ascosphaera acerosa]
CAGTVAIVEVFAFLRTQYLTKYAPAAPAAAAPLAPQTSPASTPLAAVYNATIMTVGFLMPCHSTPWRSHLVFPAIHAWALSCEPPVDMAPRRRAAYLDEADLFYADVAGFLASHMQGGFDARALPAAPSYASPRPALHDAAHPCADGAGCARAMHDWPDYLVFYQQLESELKRLLAGSAYGECHRSFNTAWHDDWRRQGDMIVYCLDADARDGTGTGTPGR